MSVTFEILGKPTAWARAQKFGKRHFNLPSMVAAQFTIAEAARPHIAAPFGPEFEGPLALDILAVFEVPKSWSKRKTATMLGAPHASKPDASNIGKQVEDALNLVAFKDDAQVADTRCVKRWGAVAKTVVTIRPLEDRDP